MGPAELIDAGGKVTCLGDLLNAVWLGRLEYESGKGGGALM